MFDKRGSRDLDKDSINFRGGKWRRLARKRSFSRRRETADRVRMISSVLREFAYSLKADRDIRGLVDVLGAPCANFYGNNMVSLVFYAPY